MNGFPLTIYFLARFFGLDLAWTKGGNLWAQLFGTPVAHIVAKVLGYAIVFSGATLVADGWRRIHRARREKKLMTDGVAPLGCEPSGTAPSTSARQTAWRSSTPIRKASPAALLPRRHQQSTVATSITGARG